LKHLLDYNGILNRRIATVEEVYEDLSEQAREELGTGN
jgi:hypothetical protein